MHSTSTRAPFGAVRDKFSNLFGSDAGRCFDYLDQHEHGLISKKDLDHFLGDQGFELDGDEVIELGRVTEFTIEIVLKTL
jgi:hypothetical protein